VIPKIKKLTDITHAFRYLEKKLDDGKGEFLGSNVFFAETREEMKQSLEETVSLNQRTYKNKFLHLSITLQANESLSNDEFRNLGLEYLTEMGYVDTPYLIYRHHDTKYPHIHILTSTVDFDGAKIKDLNDCFNSEIISRKLERKYNLLPIMTNVEKNAKLTSNEYNAQKYAFQNALLKAIKSYDSKNLLLKNLSPDLIKDLKSQPISKDVLEKRIPQEKLVIIKNHLIKKGYLQSTAKEQLIKTLDQALSESRNMTEYLKNCKENNIEIRKLFKNGNPHFYYKSSDISISDRKLPAKFRRTNLIYLGKKKQNIIPSEKQEAFIKSKLTKNLQVSSSLEQLKDLLLKDGIELNYGKQENEVPTFKLLVGDNTIEFADIKIYNSLLKAQVSTLINKAPIIASLFTDQKETTSSQSSKPEKHKLFTYDEQRKFLSNVVRRQLWKSNSVVDLKEKLAKMGIETLFMKNSGGIYGIKFKSNNIPNGYEIPGSKLDKSLSYNKIIKTIEEQELKPGQDNTINTQKKEYSREEQLNYLQLKVNKLKTCPSLSSARKLLFKDGIELIASENKNGIYQIQFKPYKIDNPECFNLEEVANDATLKLFNTITPENESAGFDNSLYSITSLGKMNETISDFFDTNPSPLTSSLFAPSSSPLFNKPKTLDDEYDEEEERVKKNERQKKRKRRSQNFGRQL
jgi:hypothetical protein